MLETQKMQGDKFSAFSPKLSDENTKSEEVVPDIVVKLEPDELKHFIDEVNKQFNENENFIDLGKAVRNARYLAKLDEGFKSMHDGTGVTMTFEELEKFINEGRKK